MHTLKSPGQPSLYLWDSYYASPFRLAFYYLNAASRRLLSYWDIFTYQLDVAFALYWDFPAGCSCFSTLVSIPSTGPTALSIACCGWSQFQRVALIYLFKAPPERAVEWNGGCGTTIFLREADVGGRISCVFLLSRNFEFLVASGGACAEECLLVATRHSPQPRHQTRSPSSVRHAALLYFDCAHSPLAPRNLFVFPPPPLYTSWDFPAGCSCFSTLVSIPSTGPTALSFACCCLGQFPRVALVYLF